MSASTFYVEHLIVGSIAVIIFFFGAHYDPEVLTRTGVSSMWTLAAIPIAYLVGILIYVIGEIPEYFIRCRTGDRDELSGIRLTDAKAARVEARSKTAVITASNQHLGLGLGRKRSRDRIIRGCMVSVLLACLLDADRKDISSHKEIQAGACFLEFSMPIVEGLQDRSQSIWRNVSIDMCIEANFLPWIVWIGLVVSWIYLHSDTRRFKDTSYNLCLMQLGLRATPRPLPHVVRRIG